MNVYQQLKKELKEKNKLDKLSKKNKIILEKAIYKDLLKKNKKCRKCGRKDMLTLEHIVPLDILRQFGVEYNEIIEDNYAITCKLCNGLKGNRLDFYFKETKEILIRLLRKI